MGNLKLGLALKSDISYGFGRAAVLVVVLVHLPLNALEQRMWRGWSSRGGGRQWRAFGQAMLSQYMMFCSYISTLGTYFERYVMKSRAAGVGQ